MPFAASSVAMPSSVLNPPPIYPWERREVATEAPKKKLKGPARPLASKIKARPALKPVLVPLAASPVTMPSNKPILNPPPIYPWERREAVTETLPKKRTRPVQPLAKGSSLQGEPARKAPKPKREGAPPRLRARIAAMDEEVGPIEETDLEHKRRHADPGLHKQCPRCQFICGRTEFQRESCSRAAGIGVVAEE